MDPSLIITAATTLLKPVLEKVGETAAKTIGERIGEKTVEKSTWQRTKNLFITDDEQVQIEAIENKSVANNADIQLLENKLNDEIANNPDFAVELQTTMNLTPANIFMAEQYLKSIEEDKKKLAELIADKRLAGIETEDQYELQIRRIRRRLEKDEQQLLDLIKSN